MEGVHQKQITIRHQDMIDPIMYVSNMYSFLFMCAAVVAVIDISLGAIEK